ncbi:helix-turn-helix transcriptional regulator [Olivibacter sp. SDN3]|uniref:helix-turn-helix domain-containing protein n=1 Tax=Olivibacter sp. SDN3 TaxID=2764720 RepID=UPI0016517A8E|nr:AraC family transcriptional regulator [Olivibacter sp. SDN3]QNL52028.1 helix-turn-helix transcriptional regulator [Olivibacter sp. SDN3]
METGTPIGLLYGPIFYRIYLHTIVRDNHDTNKPTIKHFSAFFLGSLIYLALYVYSRINVQGEVWLYNYYYPCYLFAMGGSILGYSTFIIFRQLQAPIGKPTLENIFFNVLLWLALLTSLPILIFAATPYFSYNVGIHVQYLIYMILVFSTAILCGFIFVRIPRNVVNNRTDLFKIYRCLLTDDLYLETNLTLDKLAHHLGSSSEKCSKILNGYIGINFYQLLANLRIRHAKKLIRNDVENRLTIEHLALLCGYRSKASFNRHFKKLTSCTPSEYKQQTSYSYEKSTNLQPS